MVVNYWIQTAEAKGPNWQKELADNMGSQGLRIQAFQGHPSSLAVGITSLSCQAQIQSPPYSLPINPDFLTKFPPGGI